MSQTIDNRIVEMQFDNKQFESGVSESLSTLDRLKQALKFDDASKNLEDFGKNVSKNIDLSGISKSVDDLNNKFSVSGIVGMEAIRKLTDFAIEAAKTITNVLDAPFKQIREGGWKRAMNIEDAKFQLSGLKITWESVADDINYAVADTAFGLDAAAKACAQLSASGVQAGDSMKAALRGISGVAAMGNTEYENIADIFTRAAGNGKVMAMELNRISQYGLNARASLSQFYNAILSGDESVKDVPEDIKKSVKAVTKGVKTTEADISEFARKSKIDFRTFSYAMDSAFGEHAKKANETFMGSLRNIKAALSKIGAEFATPIIQGAIPVFNEIRIFLNDLRKQMGPVFEVFKNIAGIISDKLTKGLQNFRYALLNWGALEHIGNAIKNVFTGVVKVFVAIKDAFEKVFPPAHNFARVVESITAGIENFSKHLVMSDEAMITFRNVMVVVFNILKGLGSILKTILPIVGKVVSMALKVVNVIVTIIAYLTTLISKLDIVKYAMNAIQDAGGLFAYAIEKVKDAFYYLKDILSDTSTITGQVFAKIKDAAITVAYVVGGTLYLAFVKLKELFSYFDAHDPLGSLIESINRLRSLPVINEIVGGIEKAFTTITEVISKAIKLFTDFVNNIKSGKTVIEALGIAASTVFGGILTIFGKLADAVKSFFGVFQRDRIIEESIEIPIANAGFAMSGMTKELTKTEGTVKGTASAFDEAKGSVTGFASSVLSKIKNIKASEVILAAYAGMLLVIAYNANELIKAFGDLTRKLSGGLFSMFKTGKTSWEKFSTGIREITVAIVALAGAVYVLTQLPSDKLDKVTSSLLKLIGLIGGLSLASTILTSFFARFGKSGNGFASFATNMLALTGGILALVGALKALEQIKATGSELWEKVGVIGALAVGLSTLTVIMSKVAPKLTLGSLSMVAFAASMLILVKALDNLSRIDLTNIKDNFMELSIVIVAFGAFAALASTIGVSSIFSLAAFLLTINVLFKNFDEIRANLEKNHIGELVVAFFANLKASFKKALEYILETYDNMSNVGKICIAIAGSVGMIAFTVLAVLLHKIEVSIKKTVISIGLIAGEIVLLSYAVTKIIESCKNINTSDIGKCVSIMAAVAGLLAVVIGITGWLAGDTTGEESSSSGLFGRKNKSSKTKTKTASTSLKQARKMLLDMGILLASIALFVNTVGKLNPTELAQAESLLWKTMTFIGVIMTVVTLITAFSRNTKGAAASAVTFVGVIALLGSIIGAFVILMNYLKDYKFDEEGWSRIATALGVMALGVVAVIAFLKVLSKSASNKNTWKSALGFTAMISAVGLIITYMTNNIKADEIGTAIALSGVLLGFMTALGLIIWGLEALSVKLQNTKAKRKAFTSTLVSIGVMIAGIAAIGLTLSKTLSQINSWGDVGKMGVIAFIFTIVLGAIGAMTLALENFAKNTKFTITQKSQKSLIWTLSMIAGFIGAFVLLARVFYQLSGVDAGRMAGQAITLGFTLGALSALAEGILLLVKKTETGWQDIAKAGVIIGGMTAIFTALALVFKCIINDINTEGVLAKSQSIILVLFELEILASLASDFGDYWKKVAIGEAALLGMVGIFWALTEIFTVIDGLKTEGILAKSQSIILVMLELEVLAISAAAVLGTFTEAGGLLAMGEVALLGMVGIFWALTEVFTIIDGLKTEGILAKSQTIVLVLLELEVLGTLSILTIPALVGGVGLIAMVGIFYAISQVFTVIDGLKTEGILAKSQTIILVLLELEVLGLLSIITTPAILTSAGLDAMVDIFGKLAIIFSIIDTLHVDGLLAKAQAVILVLRELEGLSVLSILGTIALIGAPGLDAMVNVFGKLAIIFTLLNGLQLEGMSQKADILIETISKLAGMGLEGFVNSIGLDDLANSLNELTSVISKLTNQATTFSLSITTMSSALVMLITTGPQITSWSDGIKTALTTVQMSFSESASSIIKIINNMIDGIVHSMNTGRVKIEAEANEMGKSVEKGFNKNLKPDLWGFELVDKFANGIRSGLGAVANAASSVAHTVWEYLHFSGGPEKGAIAGNSLQIYGMEGAQMYGQGWTDGIPGLENILGNVTGTIKNAFTNIDLNGLVDVSSLLTGEGDLMSKLNNILQAIGLVKGELGSLHTIGHGTKDDFLYQLQGSARGLEKELDRCNQAATRLSSNGTRSGENAKKKAAEVQKQLDGVNAQILELTTGVKQATPEVKELGDGLGGLGDKGKKGKEGMTEIKDEIADFYDKMEGAISLFDEFNKETELTSDQLISNMRSQIEGMTEWANQIQKLAFMGIDQGLLQQLADMGPQGYEYTNAFVHMTADQLAEANNLYHQSLMLPSKVTSQIYGSYTIAGRSAASGFLQGMNREQIKEAAVGFAHDVVDQMNLALDIVSGYSKVTYEDGVAVVNGVKTGMNAPYVKQNLDTAVKLLADNNIKAGFENKLINNDTMYTIGANVTNGIANGIEDDKAKGKAKKSIENLCGMIIKRAEQMFDTHSPSKVFKEIGGFLTKGLAIGITDEARSAVSAMGTTSEDIINTMRETINKANEALIEGVNEPVITPVLDLSEIENGSRELDSMLSRNQAFNASRSFTNLQNQQWGSQSALLNATMDNTDVVGAIASIKDDIVSLKDAMTNIRMVLDTGTMVGAMTPMIDKELGMRKIYAGRGI